MSGWLVGYSLGCQPVDYSNSPQALRVSKIIVSFYRLVSIHVLVGRTAALDASRYMGTNVHEQSQPAQQKSVCLHQRRTC